MRADRLLSILLLLQTRGRMTCQRLAIELEVSERTIYRDITALNSAGIPVYTESGPGGGISLVESYQTTLTGLRSEEVQALSMLNIPEPLVRLGVEKELKGALLKLAAAIPPSLREQQTQVRHRIHLDSTRWFQPEEPTPHLQIIQKAVLQDKLIRIISKGDFGVTSEQVVAPLGLVAKENNWYLVFTSKDYIRARRVSRIISAEILPQSFDRPANFDLVAFWQKWCADYENDRPQYAVLALVSPTLATRLPLLLQDNQLDILNAPPVFDKERWQVIDLFFDSFENARLRILGFGGAIEVLEPLALRRSVVDYAHQIQALYPE